jgi:hypothetical protein
MPLLLLLKFLLGRGRGVLKLEFLEGIVLRGPVGATTAAGRGDLVTSSALSVFLRSNTDTALGSNFFRGIRYATSSLLQSSNNLEASNLTSSCSEDVSVSMVASIFESWILFRVSLGNLYKMSSTCRITLLSSFQVVRAVRRIW